MAGNDMMYRVYGEWEDHGEHSPECYRTLEEARKAYAELIEEQKDADEPYDCVRLDIMVLDEDGEILEWEGIQCWEK